MRKSERRDIDALFRAGAPIDHALRRGVRAAVTAPARAGQPLVTYRDGKVVRVSTRKARRGMWVKLPSP
jgi:hypothetical protein